MRKFLVAVQGLSTDNEKTFINYLSSKGFGWWHWIENVWLITTNDQNVTISEIRGKLDTSSSVSRNMVIEVSGHVNWCGYGPSSANNNMFEWFEKNWQIP